MMPPKCVVSTAYQRRSHPQGRDAAVGWAKARRRVRRKLEVGRAVAHAFHVYRRMGKIVRAMRDDVTWAILPTLRTRSRSSGIAESGIEQVADPRREALLGDRLLDHRHAGIEPALVDDGVAGITRREQHHEIRSSIFCLFRQLPAVHAREHHVGQKQIDADVGRLDQAQSRYRIVRAEHAIVQIAQQLHQIGADIAVVLDHEDRFIPGAFHRLGRLRFLLAPINVLQQARKIDFGMTSGLALQ